MRVDLEPVDDFLRLLRENQPCPQCGSSRVTVRRDQLETGPRLRCECADCRRTCGLDVEREN